MKNEPIEFNLKTSARTRISPRQPEQLPAAEVLDAAFDDYRRVDVAAPRSECSRRETAHMTKALIADIAAQLDVLDRQREQLASLLRDVNL